ncbi:MAG: hypothetical protein OEY24_05695 [Candidatus Bathyarchaeota archaeon]|nr:hypothetical protein [Candidatus Bathyarchaeota archaeon]MDH5495178.1 hypothetical protein [Candidatus Bathyarchaeota archaeon]
MSESETASNRQNDLTKFFNADRCTGQISIFVIAFRYGLDANDIYSKLLMD